MSNSLVKQSLSLFDDGITELQPGTKKRKSTDPMKQISTKKKGVKKELKKLQTQHQRIKPQSSKKSSLQERQWSGQETDFTEYSVKALKRLEKIKAADPGTATAIVDHHHRVVSRARTKVKDTDKPSDNDTSAFTEDDFKKFAEEFDFKWGSTMKDRLCSPMSRLCCVMARDINKHIYSDTQTNLRVLLDLDQVLADFEGHFLKEFRRKFPDEPYVELKDREGFYIKDQYDVIKPGLGDKCTSIWTTKRFFQNLEEIPGAVAAAREMASMKGVDVFICTSPIIQYKYCLREKFHWVEKHLGPSWVNRIILTRDKTMVAGHVLIDDKVNITGLNLYPTWEHIVFSACHNVKTDLKGKIRLDNWTDGSWRDIIEDFKKRI